MNRNVLLVAIREFRQVAAMKSFWLTLLLIPAALAIGPIFTRALDEDEAARVVVIDRVGGGAADAVEQRFGMEDDRRTLRALSRYVRRHSLESADPQAPWTQHDRWYTDADVAAYRQAGGVDADSDAGDGKAADLVLLIGEGYPEDPTVRLWSKDQPRASFVATLREVLTADLQQRLLTSQGLSQESALAIRTAAPAIAVTTPPPGGGAREAMLIRSIVPLALSYILMMSLMLSGSWMLQGSVEERSNKLLESLLACIRPEELMYGKLLGALAVGLSMITVWVGFAVAAAFLTQGAIADMIRPALAPITSPDAIIAMIFFFVAGYVAISIIFVAIGALADSMSEAQGYLMPVLLGILLPITLLLNTIVAGKDGLMVQLLTWIPLWTPFAVLARLGSGIEWWEMVGAGLLLAAFVALEVIFLGRLFRASLLATGQKPGLRQLMDRFRTIRE